MKSKGWGNTPTGTDGILIKRGRFRDTDKQGEVAVMQLHKPRNNKNGWKIPDSRKH